MLPIEKIAANGMVIEGMNEEQYESMRKYLEKIAKTIEHPLDEMENGDWMISYFLDNERKQAIHTYPEKRKIRILDDVDINVIEQLRALSAMEGD